MPLVGSPPTSARRARLVNGSAPWLALSRWHSCLQSHLAHCHRYQNCLRSCSSQIPPDTFSAQLLITISAAAKACCCVAPVTDRILVSGLGRAFGCRELEGSRAW